MNRYIYLAVGAREATMSISAAVVDCALVLTMRCCFGHSSPTITTRPHSQHTPSDTLKCVKDPVSLLHVRKQKAEAAQMGLKHETGRTG